MHAYKHNGLRLVIDFLIDLPFLVGFFSQTRGNSFTLTPIKISAFFS